MIVIVDGAVVGRRLHHCTNINSREFSSAQQMSAKAAAPFLRTVAIAVIASRGVGLRFKTLMNTTLTFSLSDLASYL